MRQLTPIHVVVTREPFADCFVLTLDNGFTEEFEPDALREWFRARGADMDRLEKILDHVFNFQYAEINFNSFKEPKLALDVHAPKLD